MKAKEKAKDLINKFIGHVRNDNPPLPNANWRSKQCALIATKYALTLCKEEYRHEIEDTIAALQNI